jgi:predicted flap endonuclease-1-like 5' DNA nuclease
MTTLSAPQEVIEPEGIPVETITGVDDAAKASLNDAGIVWLEEFLEVAGPADGRKALATQTGIDASQLLEWVNRADLMRIAGITAAFADLLENAGVDTVRELAQRNPANLYQKLYDAAGNEAPPEGTVVSWIAAAKTLPAAITH